MLYSFICYHEHTPTSAIRFNLTQVLLHSREDIQTGVTVNWLKVSYVILLLLVSAFFRVLAHLSKSNSRTFQGLSRTIQRLYKENNFLQARGTSSGPTNSVKALEKQLVSTSHKAALTMPSNLTTSKRPNSLLYRFPKAI